MTHEEALNIGAGDIVVITDLGYSGTLSSIGNLRNGDRLTVVLWPEDHRNGMVYDPYFFCPEQGLLSVDVPGRDWPEFVFIGALSPTNNDWWDIWFDRT
ncbi:MAG: hypothetical protein ACXABY_10840 [Candidatus Thorarchaeota archaeon]|jgi:hypothetical protein